MNKQKLKWFVLTVFLLTIFSLTTCDMPMGMGDSIDWEPPVLTLDPLPNPLYVRNGTEITGTATDNIGVTKVVMTNSITGELLSTATLDGKYFKFVLEFDESKNGERISARIDAYDRAGRNDSRSSAFITITIDLGNPIIEKKYIQRTNSQIADLMNLQELKKLENVDDKNNYDPNGEKKDNIYKYQNGWFSFKAEIEDEETQVDIVNLKIYDASDQNKINDLLMEIEPDPGTSKYYPEWTIKEENIIAAGKAKWGDTYEEYYYVGKPDVNGKNVQQRYYYRIVVTAVDKSKNEKITINEDEGYMCMWAKSDEPKGIFDESVYVKDKAVSRGAQLPVDFFDDDMLEWAYAGLITKAQWEGTRPLTSGTNGYICGGSGSLSTKTDQEKIQWLKEKITGLSEDDPVDGSLSAPTIYNWRYDKHSDTGSDAEFVNQITTKVDQKLVYIPIGNDIKDYGDYVFFTIMADKKTYLNGGSGPKWTNQNIWCWKKWDFAVVDQNLPLIVFDTTSTGNGDPDKGFPTGSPEENTFPTPLKDGEYFTIHGYTLRDAGAKDVWPNSVETFRMAWIPNALATDANIEDTKANLKSGEFYSSIPGIVYYDATPTAKVTESTTLNKKLLFQTRDYVNITDATEDDYAIDDGSIKQIFSIKFSVLKDFTYVGVNENTTKLFVFYAQDNMKNEVYRELRLLGSMSKPEVTVYDVTNEISNDNFNLSNNKVPSDDYGLPDPNKYTILESGGPDNNYYIQLTKANDTSYGYTKIKSGVEDGGQLKGTLKLSEPFLTYPRGTIIKYWLKVKGSGVVDIADIKMDDITYSGKPKSVGKADTTNKLNASDGQYYSLSFCEYYPDVSQRTFLFTVTDKLGNEAKVQRTIAITNAAQLDNITTSKQSATYGAGTEIILQANFTGQVYLKEDKDVFLNVTYNINGTPQYEKLPIKTPRPTKSSPVSSLEFVFKVPLNADGQLKTMNDGISGGSDKKPLDLNGNTILDSLRSEEGGGESEAFVPGVITGTISVPNWSDDKKSLQEKKTIMLDGKKPLITTTSVGGKDPYQSTNQYYFKSGETIELTLSTGTGKEISFKGTPKLRYQIKQSGGTNSAANTTAFAYARPNGEKSLVFTLPVNSTNADGELVNVTLIDDDDNTIIDNYDNHADTSLTDLIAASEKRVFIKKAVPTAPTTAGITGITDFGINPTTEIKLRTEPTVNISDSISVWTNTSPAETIAWESAQYSKDNGVTWTDGSSFKLENSFKNTAQVRYVDRAGNEGTALKQLIQVNTGFPNLVSVSATQSNGWYRNGANLEFNLSFASPVNVTSTTGVSITLTNEGQSYIDALSPDSYTYQKVLTAEEGTDVTTVKFKWNSISNKEMQQGLYISRINLGGLTDSFGNTGGTGTGTGGAPTSSPMSNPITITTATGSTYSTVINLPKGGIKVDAITPSIDTWAPDNSAKGTVTVSGNNAIENIVLTFREPVIKGSGVITIRPRGNYAIPPVIRDKGYYIGTDDNEYISLDAASTKGVNATYISSFYDIYNNSALDSTDRNNLTQGSSMSALDTNARTGQSAGPYKKTTHGLIEGPGYTGNNTDYAVSGSNAPNLKKLVDGKYENVHTAMIPDTATKWVLDYRYLINDTTANSAVTKIRGVLTKAKWRWQEIDVVNTDITSNIVTIKLNEPLLKGLEWDVYYPAGTFTDEAGNPAEASDNTTYYFTTPGVQPPVIRVDRRSYDGRNANWKTSADNGGTSYTQPGSTNGGIPFTTANWTTNTIVYTDTGLGTDGGWGINDFNSVHYRVECESPGAEISAKYYKGAYSNNGGVKAGWNDAGVASTNSTTAIGGTDVTWSAGAANVAGTWILPNLIRRSRTSGTVSYNVITKSGDTETRKFEGAYRGFRSYNKDLTKGELDAAGTGFLTAALSTNDDASKNQGVITGFEALESSKSYVVAQAKKNGQPATGYEGIFRTVVAYGYGSDPPVSDNLFIEGSNIKNGMPSVAGFPVRDAEETGDRRFVKRFHMIPASTTPAVATRTQFYWVSTEIVCEWYLLCWGGGTNRTHQDVGEVNNYLTVGYGDLTYGRSITRSGY